MYGIPDSVKPLSAAEEQVMLAVWACRAPATRRDIDEKLRAKGWAPATVLNFLYRLEEKGWVKSGKDGNHNTYTPAITRRAYHVWSMDNVLEGMRDNLEQHQTVLGNLLQQMEDAKVEVKRPFPQEAELAEKSERLAALNVALNIGGKDKPNSRERQKHDGKTSIKRLLRRMGVESAASAAPKKDKEMEVAI